MGLFDFFKGNKDKEEASFDPLDIRIEDLKKGDLFDYNLETWTVAEEFEYDWGDECFTKELLVEKGSEKKYLTIDIEDGLEITLQEKVTLRSLDENFVDHLMDVQEPLKKVQYNGVKYFKDAKNYGYYRNVNTKSEGEECISWDFYDADEKHILTIEQWGENEFEVSVGKVIKPSDISDILPSSK